MLRRRLLALLLASTALGGGAHGDAPLPTLVLRATGGEQRGILAHGTQWRPAGPGRCLGMVADGPGAWPEPVRHDRGSSFTVRLPRPDRPAEVTPRAWRLVVAGRPVDPERTLAYRLDPVRERGRVVAWQLTFGPPDLGDHHLDVFVRWPANRCGADTGSWRFRLRAL